MHEDDPDEYVEVTAESIGTAMKDIGIRLDPVTEHIPRFRLSLPTINFPQLIVKAFFYMLCEKNTEVCNLIIPTADTVS